MSDSRLLAAAGVWYVYAAGTSMAAPHASGVAALADSKYNRTLNGFAIRDRMYGGADDLGVAGKDDIYGFGRINAYKTALR